MHIEFDLSKNAINIRERGLSFEQAADFDFGTAIIDQDTRRAYPEIRFVAVGFLDRRLHVLCASLQQLVAFASSAFARPTSGRQETMTKRVLLTDADGEVRELTAADLRHFKPIDQVLSPELLKVMGIKKRGPQKAPTKQATTIRLSPDVMAAFKATGAGWQTRIDAALKDWLRTHSPV